ncbi:MAG: DUF58 domain-containing protein [Verrucomicrobia bacterium]|nr:DUF58 domain-containing protein [Verrucomicrobiota bacterium]MCH8513364.1 DUF58 domain-containing protein [Kiritimatiellia bacterium]
MPKTPLQLDWPAPEQFRILRRDARAAAGHLRLCLQQRNWRGAIGNWSGAGIGSSIDFQDHRPYLPGDDPRYIDWAAYARSGNYIMKLYREEVSPGIDLILDLSRSMTWDASKRDRLFGLAAFCLESAAALGARPRMTGISGDKVHLFDPALLAGNAWPAPEFSPADGPPRLEMLPLQSGSLRIFISDLLYDQPPTDLMRPLTAGKGRVALLVPYLRLEEDPDWQGNLELIDCETGGSRRQRVDPGVLASYRQAYERHFEAWREACRRYNARFARIPCEPSLVDSLGADAFQKGVVEAWA